MAYQANIPQPSDQLKDSQADLLANFQSINTNWEINHIGFNEGTNAGKHYVVTLPEVGIVPVTAADEMMFYTDEDSSSGSAQTEMFIQRESAAENIPFTAGRRNTNGFMYTPNGMIIKWGSATVTTGANGAITFPTGAGIPAFGTAVYSVILSGNRTSASWVPIVSNDAGLNPPADPLVALSVFVAQSDGNTGSSTTVSYWVIGI